MFEQVLLNAVMLSTTYVLLALGLTLIFGVMVVINFAHGSIYMWGAFVLWSLYGYFGLNYPLSVVITFIVMFALGVAVDTSTLSPVRGDLIRGIIITLGVMYILDAGGLLAFGHQERVVPPVITGVLHIGEATFAAARLLPTIFGVVLIVGLLLFLQHTKIGRALRATAQDRETASLHGINPRRMFALSFGIGSGLAGVAAALMAPLIVINPFLGPSILWKCLIIIIVGGLGSIPGSILAGCLLGLNDSFLATYVGSNISQLVAFLLVIILLIFRPRGLMGAYEL